MKTRRKSPYASYLLLALLSLCQKTHKTVPHTHECVTAHTFCAYVYIFIILAYLHRVKNIKLTILLQTEMPETSTTGNTRHFNSDIFLL